ncbi:STAS domain-containing protein [Thioalkalivibrio sp. XN279]|uniref:STAS domain-containing protein n=1 Tax=Thioalkalivibrio sp. XN279 TaxID=2714953 RepID=UPI00140B1F6C|nr:STAS domain-containing protein [Thioalkalivibrio sp. XN279]NHA13392.1 STAS domain-containing protein [Thioalkalivibrio sp. XN279]
MKSLTLPPDLRIQHASSLQQRLLQALEGTGRLRLRAAAVERVDAAGLQLLLAAQHEADRRGRSMDLEAPAPVLLEGLQRLGLGDRIPTQATTSGGGKRRRNPQEKVNGKNPGS